VSTGSSNGSAAIIGGAAAGAGLLVIALVAIMRRRARLSAKMSRVPGSTAAGRFDTIDAGVFYESPAKQADLHVTAENAYDI